MKNAHERFDPSEIEAKWQNKWASELTYQPDLRKARKPYYNLMMFPYPSAEGLHVGNMYAFTGSDIYGRFKRMQGFDVFEPIGLDGFGIHSENYAMKIGEHPQKLSKKTQENFYRQLKLTGNGFAWNNKVETYDSAYYKWTQWIFVKLFKAGLVYRGTGEVNWCPSCLTVLADEQVLNSDDNHVCERCGTEVVKKELTQWYFRITGYSQRLLDGISKIDWSEKVTLAQKNWIGKSEGTEILFFIDIDKQYSVRIFTTRADTICGVTFLALAVDHELVTTILEHANGHVKQAIRDFLANSKRKTGSKNASGQKSGIFTGFYATNPLNLEQVPVYIADYVLTGYGTGAVMGVPAHDQRDFEFAKKYQIEIRQVIKSGNDDVSHKAFTGYGKLVNSGIYDRLDSKQAISKITHDLELKGQAKVAVNWHLRDWIISRQRYWGPPIPMIFCRKCAKNNSSWFTTQEAINYSQITNSKLEIRNSGWDSAGWYPVPEEDLPVELPYIEKFKPTGSGVAPLAQDKKFTNVKCPGCGSEAERETDVSDTFLDSAWYFLRYPSSGQNEKAWDEEVTKKWLPVDMYIGGAEHSVLHLLYSRFLTKVFYDLKLVTFDEPFEKFRAHGLLIKDGAKMSKSRGNVVNPDDYVAKFGADTLRAYLMFCGRFSEGGDFRDEGIEGMHKFLKRVWKLVGKNFKSGILNSKLAQDAQYMMHKTIKKVTEDIENLNYNTAIAAMMEWMNFLEKQEKVSADEVKNLLKVLAPFAPHITEELWQEKFAHAAGFKSIHTEKWPSFSHELTVLNDVTLVVQVNGKLRDRLVIKRGAGQSEVEELARKSGNVSKYINGGESLKVVFVKDRLINFVTASGKS